MGASFMWPRKKQPVIIRHAIVTGASSGIGRELVRQMVLHKAFEDVRVIATARRTDRLEELAALLPPGRVLIFPADLAKHDDRLALWQFAQSRLGKIDLLVNNAGLGAYGPFHQLTDDQISRIFAVDVEAVIHLTSLALKQMIPAGTGQIVQVSSILGEVGIPYSSAYVAAKHAVNGLVKSVRYELAGTGVKIWAACPGQTESEFRKTAGQGFATDRGRNAEPTHKVVSGILKGITSGYSGALLYPTWTPWLIAQVARISPGLWDTIMVRYGKKVAFDDRGPAEIQ